MNFDAPPSKLSRVWSILAGVALLLIAGTLFESMEARKSTLERLQVPTGTQVVDALRTLGQEHLRAGSRFEIALPAGWARLEGPDALAYDLVVWDQARGASISLMATPVDYDDLQRLGVDIRKRESEYQIATVPDIIHLQDRPVIQRKVRLAGGKVLAIDYIESRIAYHILCSAPTDLFDVYEPLFLAVAASVRPLAPIKPAAGPGGSDVAGTPGNG